MKNNKVATTVKIPSELYDQFKVLGIRHKLPLQTFVEKCVNMFVSDENFRNIVNSYSIPLFSQSLLNNLKSSTSGSLSI